MKSEIFIIDGHALLYRAFYAFEKQHLTNAEGFPTGAIYGFVQYLLRIVETYNPEFLLTVFDSGKPSARHAIYPAYKENRAAMPPDLVKQLPYIRYAAKLFGKIAMHDGIEADDIIYTNVIRSLSVNFNVSIVSKDKDLMQMLSPNVRMLAPNGTGVFEEMSDVTVAKKFGVTPGFLKYYLALVGDNSDNIPGVHGIGPKKARIMIAEYGSSVADHLFGKDKERFKMSLKLVTLSYEEATISSSNKICIQREALQELLLQMGIKSLNGRVSRL